MKQATFRIGMTYDLRDAYLEEGYSEIETAELDRVDTIDSIESVLLGLGYEVDRIGNVKQLAKRLVNGDSWDLVFNICEGMHGIAREAQVPALLDAYQIPYVFSDALICALTLHKGITKDVVRAAQVATPDYLIVHKMSDIKTVELDFPLFAKPIAEGTGKGITAKSKVNNLAELQRLCRGLLKEHEQPVLVERFLPGREFTVGITGTGSNAVALASLEIVLLEGAESEVYSYHNKENCEELVEYRLVPPSALKRQVEAVALGAWRALGCRDGGRIDLRQDQHGQTHFIEVNPLAGLHPEHSDLPIMATMSGVSYTSLITRILQSALDRCGGLQLAAVRHAN
jgi:D-alanine-D-alanine ligase